MRPSGKAAGVQAGLASVMEYAAGAGASIQLPSVARSGDAVPSRGSFIPTQGHAPEESL